MAIPAPPAARAPTPGTGLPLAALPVLARAVRSEAGPEAAARVLQRAGYDAGGMVYRDFAAGVADGDPSSLANEGFWTALGDFLRARGWGHVTQGRVHPGMGLLTAHEWAEAASSEGGEGCPFSTGMLARILGEAAGGPIAVLQVACPTRGDDAARFLFGHPEAVTGSHALLAEGAELARILAQV
jgi:predicted hydrocarbon binding protein